jgi:hypothetical protein
MSYLGNEMWKLCDEQELNSDFQDIGSGVTQGGVGSPQMFDIKDLPK